MKQKDIRSAAALLGSLNRGKKKILSSKEKLRRKQWMAEIRKKRWPSKNEPSQE
jgi:hypothetical protein